MKLAFSTNAFTRFTLPQAIDAIADAGYDGVEILADAPHAYPGVIDLAFAREVRSKLESRKLAVSNVNCNCSFGYWRDAPPEPYFEPSLISPTKKHREDRIELIAKAIDFAREIGGRSVSITSGRMLGAMRPELAQKQLHESLRRVLDVAEAKGIDLGIECEPGLYVETALELKSWIDRLGSPRLGANLDVGHCQVLGETIAGAIATLAGSIWNLHVEGMPGSKHYHLVPGDPLDTLDWPGLARAILASRYDRFATVELYTMTDNPYFAAAASMMFLSPWASAAEKS